MPLITETYYLSLTQDNRGILRLRCSQDDTLRTVNLKLYNNGSIFVIPSGISAFISGVKQNGAVFSKPCTISQDRKSVVLQLSSDITNVDGIIVAEIVLNDGEGGRLGTSNFIIQVEKNPIRAGVVQDTETPIEYINDFIEKIQTLTARLNNLITPSGDPSLAEVVDARIGILDSTTYQTLGARLNAEFQRLSNVLNGVTILESTGDTTDRTSEILSKLNTYGTCKLVKGDFYVNNLVMPEGSHLIGSGKSTRIILPSSVTNGYVVKPKSNCIIENVSFYGGFTGTYSELIASSASATRHCIILDRFDSVNSENVILSNISINNFVGSAIIQRYATGCHCKDVVINMCYAGIDISNASYDGQCINISMTNTRYGIVQNGSNFVFTNCISKDSEYHIMSDQQNTECTFSSCTFSDSSLETTSILAYLSNARNGFVFDNCTFDSSLKMGLNACDGIVIKGTNFVGSDTFRIIVSNGRNTLLLITDCIADVEPVVTNAGTAARITSCYLKDGTAWSISEADIDITVDDELSDESENPVQNKVINREISEIKADLGAIKATDLSIGVAWVDGKAIHAGTGELYTSSAGTGSASAYIDISGCSKIVYMRPVVNSTSVPKAGIAFYDSSKTYIANSGVPSANKSGGGNPEINTVDVPEGAVYVRCTYIRTDSELIADYPFFLYDYADYSSTLDAKVGKNTDDISTHGTQITALQEALESVKDNNLVKVEGASMEKTLRPDGVNPVANASYNTTGYIDVSGVKYLFLNYGYRYWFYDSEKAGVTTENAANISPIYNGVKRITVPDGAAYFRISIGVGNWDNAFIYASPILDAIFYSIEQSVSGQKVLYTIGDSITKGMYANIGSSSSSGPTTYCYAYWIAQLNGYTLHNLGVSDTGYVSTDGNGENNGPDIVDNNDFDGADYITIAYGINDYKRSENVPIGSLAESTLNDGTIVGNMRYTIETIIGKAPQAKLFIISPMNGNRIMGGVSSQDCILANNWYMGCAVNGRTLADIKEAIKEVAEYYGIELIDLQQVGPINRLNIRTLAGDGLHPSIIGHEMIGRTLSAFIK